MAQEEGGNLGDESMAALWLTRRYGDGNKNRLRWTRTCECVDDIKGRNCASFLAEGELGCRALGEEGSTLAASGSESRQIVKVQGW